MTKFFRATNGSKFLALFLLTSVLILISVNSNLQTVKAQGTDSVYLYESCGGIVSASGATLTGGTTYNYTAGSTVTFTATPLAQFKFLCWDYANSTGAATSTNDPFNYKITSTGCAIQPMFVPDINASLAQSTSQTGQSPFDVLISIGGTTSPGAAIYTNYSIGDIATFTAKPADGFKFLYWLVPAAKGGSAVSTDNPLKFNVTAEACAVQGYFIPQSSSVTLPSITSVSSSSPSPTPTVNEFSSAAEIMVGAVLVLVAFGTIVYVKRKEK
ncbi:MAG: InlB B-repeat-containing protein [Candidatus Bathyarchaeia archaeon]